MARTYNVSFNITGTESGLLAALKSAQAALRGLGNSARAASAAAKASQAGLQGLGNQLKNIQTAATQFKTLQDALKQTAADFSKATSSIGSARAKMEADAQAAQNLRDRLSDLNKELGKAKTTKLTEQGGLRTLRQQMQELKRAFALAKSLGDTAKMASLNSQMATLGATIQAQQSKVKAAAQAYKELSDKIKQTRTDLKAAEQAATSSGQGLTRARADAERLKQAYTDQLAALGRLRSSLSAAGFNVSSFASSESRLQSEINRVNAAIERQQNLLNAQNRSAAASQEMFNAYNNFQGTLQTAQQIASPFTAAIDKAIEFERVMSEVRALTQMDNIKAGKFDVVEREMAALEAQAKELGATTIYQSHEVGAAQAYIARTGWSTAQVLGSVPVFLKLAASQNMDIARTADLATNIMTAFGHTLDSVGGDADQFAKLLEHDASVMAYTVTHSNQTFEQFGEAMKYAAPVAKQFGATIEETAMMTKFMADAGIQGSMAGTSMRQTMLRLVSPPKKATKAMEQYGITLDDANAAWQNANAVAKEYGVTLEENVPVGRQFINIMRQIDKNMAGASDREKLGAISAITGVNAVSGAANLFGAGAKQAENFTELLEQCSGALEQTYNVMTNNTYGAQKSFESAWEAVQLSIGYSLKGIARTAYETFAPILISLSQFINAHPGVVQAVAAIAGALAGLVVAAAAVKLAFAGWRFIASSIGLVQDALASLGSGALLGGLIGRLATLRAALFGVGGAATFAGWSKMFTAISESATAAAVAVRKFFASLTLGNIASSVVSGLTKIGTAIRGAAMAAMSFAFSPVGVALMALALAGLYCYQNWDRVAPVLSNIAGIITGALSSALQTIQPAIQNLMAAFDNLANNGAIQMLIDSLGMLATGALATIATAIAGVLATVINVGATILSTIANVISGIVNLISNVLAGNWSAAWENMKSIAISVVEGMADAIKGILDGILTTVKAIGDAWDFLKGKTPHVGGGSGGDFGQPHIGGGGGGDFGQPQVSQVSQPVSVPETPTIDTSATQAALDAVGTSAQTAATNMDGVNTATQNISQAGDALSQLPANLSTATTGIQQVGTDAQTAGGHVQTLGTNSQTAGLNVQAVGSAAQTASPQVDALGVSSGGAQGNVAALGDSAGGSVGNILSMSDAAGAVASALRGKAAEIGAIHISIPTVSVGGAPAANYEGGIYKRGAFLTTFAERSPEAAIPLDNSQRAKDLWRQAGEMLGLLPQNQPFKFDKIPTTPPFNPEPEKTLPRGEQVPTRARRRPPQRQRRRPQIPPTQPVPQIKIPDWAMQPLPPFNPDASKSRPPITFGGDLSGGIFNPQTPAFDSDGLIGGLVNKIFGSPKSEPQPPIINLTVNVTINGDADEATVQRGVEAALPAVNDWARRYSEHQHEQRRRSYA